MLEPSPRDLQQRCAKCKRRHRPTLRCWSGRYAMGMVRHVLNTQGRTCWICGGRATSADHVTPRSLGGDDTDANLRPACQPCNAKRGAQENPFDAEEPAALNGPPVSSRWGR